jgi:hypothetical protein
LATAFRSSRSKCARRAQPGGQWDATEVPDLVRGVALIPGNRRIRLGDDTRPFQQGAGPQHFGKRERPQRRNGFRVSLDHLVSELPNCGSVSLVVSWFGNDLRCGQCQVKPKVEQTQFDGVGMPWRAGGIARSRPETVPKVEGRSIYGGTPADASVLEAIAAIRDAGREVMFYPFILMDQVAGNALPDPWSGGVGQPALPWRGRITTLLAPGKAGTTDRTAAADAEVASFFGTAAVSDFQIVGADVLYTGPAEWSYRRFILHYAHLCAAAGGVDAFCIGSEMRSLTQIRGSGDSFPAVSALIALLQDVRAVLGPVLQDQLCRRLERVFVVSGRWKPVFPP